MERPSGRRRRLFVWLAIALVAVMALAWFDGGEEPVRPITVDIPLPEGR